MTPLYFNMPKLYRNQISIKPMNSEENSQSHLRFMSHLIGRVILGTEDFWSFKCLKLYLILNIISVSKQQVYVLQIMFITKH